MNAREELVLQVGKRFGQLTPRLIRLILDFIFTKPDLVLGTLVEAGFQGDHVVIFTEQNGWTLQHSLGCRVNGQMSHCPELLAICKITGDLRRSVPIGQWRITEIDSEGLPSLERVP